MYQHFAIWIDDVCQLIHVVYFHAILESKEEATEEAYDSIFGVYFVCGKSENRKKERRLPQKKRIRGALNGFNSGFLSQERSLRATCR